MRRWDRVLPDDVICTDYGQIDLIWDDEVGFDGDFDRFFAGRLNGMAGAAHPGSLYLNLARRSGGSPVRIVLCDDTPADEPSYQDVVEVSISIPEGSVVRWASWAGETGRRLPELDPGQYRVRISARDRDAGRAGQFEDGPIDAYLVQLWREPVRADAIVRVGSQNAEYWHREIGSRRDPS